MSDLSFDIKTSKDFLVKLQEDYSEFCFDKTSSRIALNCALTAWHLTEWIYNEYNSLLKTQYPSLNNFQQDIKKLCPSLQIMHDIANGTKHYLLVRHQPIIDDTSLHHGTFNIDFNRDFDISTLDIELKNGSTIYFDNEIQVSINFGYIIFNQNLINILISKHWQFSRSKSLCCLPFVEFVTTCFHFRSGPR